jgi:tellurite resistance protein TerC
MAWITLALAFAFCVYWQFGFTKAIQFASGYVVELSLSLDNLFVFVLIFKALEIPAASQRRVLFWGILGALVMRGLLIGVGVTVFRRFAWIEYPLGVLLILAGIRALIRKHASAHSQTQHGLLVRQLKRLIPSASEFKGDRFLVIRNARLRATPLLLALVAIELADAAFALDSIPAVIALSREPYIVYTSNMFAIFGLRSMYSALALAITKFRHLNVALSLILTFVGVKLLVSRQYVLSPAASLATIATILLGTLAFSAWRRDGTGELAVRAGDDAQALSSEGAIQARPASLRALRRVAVTIVGLVVLGAGVAMIVLPGPAVVVIPIGLGILSSEYRWARAALEKLKSGALRLGRRRSNQTSGTP